MEGHLCVFLCTKAKYENPEQIGNAQKYQEFLDYKGLPTGCVEIIITLINKNPQF